MAKDYIDAEKGVETAEDALKGAMDIIAEIISAINFIHLFKYSAN